MDEENIRELLFFENDIELIQKKTGENVNDQHLAYDQQSIPQMPEKNFFKEGNIFVNKHHRYSKMPAHTHEFVEFNYMYSGECVQYVDNQRIVFKEGDLLLMDRNSVQKISKLGYNDILINILLKNESITTDILINMVETDGIMSEFLLGKTKSVLKSQRYLYFNTAKNKNVRKILDSLILEYYKKEKYYMRMANLQLSMLLIELTKILDKESISEFNEDTEVIKMLKYIELNYKTLTLLELSKEFGYSKNYLSDKLKKETGRSYKELVDYTRYKVARELLSNTTYPITTISERIGYESLASIYKLFKKYTDQTPAEIKKNE